MRIMHRGQQMAQEEDDDDDESESNDSEAQVRQAEQNQRIREINAAIAMRNNMRRESSQGPRIQPQDLDDNDSVSRASNVASRGRAVREQVIPAGRFNLAAQAQIRNNSVNSRERS